MIRLTPGRFGGVPGDYATPARSIVAIDGERKDAGRPAEPRGLTENEARRRQAEYGLNQVAPRRVSPARQLATKLWGPIPWMLEFTFILELWLHKPVEAIIIAFLLIFNAVLGFAEERRAQGALELLRSQLRVQARVLRDGQWREISATELVPGDYVHLRMGDFAPADMRLDDGSVLVDQSALTGESAPVERGPDTLIYSGSVIRRGEASGSVTATGSRSYFGKTAELVRDAQGRSSMEALVLGIVRTLMILDGALVAAILVYASTTHLSLSAILPFALILLVASVPVALPATFTLTAAVASVELAQRGVLLTHLPAIEEAAAMNQLCTDKTGTLTQNQLTVVDVIPSPGVSAQDVLAYAALASDPATQDPLDLAVIARAQGDGVAMPPRLTLTPFDPATKRSEATFAGPDGTTWTAMKGAPQTIAALSGKVGWEQDGATHAERGARLIAVAAGPSQSLRWLGMVALADPPRPDAQDVLARLMRLGVQVRMLTGDSVPTARAVARQLGLTGPVVAREDLATAGADAQVYAGVLPEDKFHIVQALQKLGHVTGMTGDGVNDAPALKQADVGIAVNNATDVAKAAASLVLTRPGLEDVIDAVVIGREVYQRLLTYTLNKIVKTLQVALFLSLGLILFHQFVVTPLLVLLLLFANDFVTMSLSGDRVQASPRPERWDVGRLVRAAAVFAGGWLVYIFGLYLAGRLWWHLPTPALQTWDFVGLVFSGLANVFLVRERSWLWSVAPGRLLAVAAAADTVVVGGLAGLGWLVAPLPWALVGVLLGVTAAYLIGMDVLKVRWLHAAGNAA
jgi:H+-transporting ATPase